jgi:hypothetical protein
VKVATPDKLCVEIDGPSGRRYSFRKGLADVSDRDGRAIVAAGGFIPSLSGTSKPGVGFTCKCGFRSYFRTCSRCGETSS